MNTPRRHLLDESRDSLSEWMVRSGEPAFRATQVLEWVYHRHMTDFATMTNLSKTLRERLTNEFEIFTSRVVRRMDARDGTVKLLLEWPDAATSECVLIPDGPRRGGGFDRMTACIGSQVGCPVGCRFCASGVDGVERNLTRGQIVEQVLRVDQLARSIHAPRPAAASRVRSPHALTNIVFMGSGEPLANYSNVLAAIATLKADWGPHVGARKITISTVGLPKQIRRLADEGLQINLALSVHAPNDALRRELIPWAEQIGLDELVRACQHYFERTGREITLEYILLAGVNDRAEHARELAALAKRLRCNVNLIRFNPVSPLPFGRPTSESTLRFQQILRQAGVNTHVRKARGLDIDAACGQLRRRVRGESAVALTVSVAANPTEPS